MYKSKLGTRIIPNIPGLPEIPLSGFLLEAAVVPLQGLNLPKSSKSCFVPLSVETVRQETKVIWWDGKEQSRETIIIPVHTLDVAFTEKCRDYLEACEREGISFIPLPVETLGGWHKKAVEQLWKLARARSLFCHKLPHNMSSC